jgi:acetyl-CoA synthetase (ADP-forming)
MTRTLSEHASSALLDEFGIPVVASRLAGDPETAVTQAVGIGFPVVVKLTGGAIAHKTERDLVRLALRDPAAVRLAAGDLLGAARPEDGDVALVVAPMLRATRELVAGLHRDPQFGPCVMVGIGGVLAEAVADVAFVPAPLDAHDAHDAIDALASQALLGPVRGEPPVDRHALAAVLVALSDLAAARPDVRAVDVNPLLVVDGVPIAVDALVEVAA